VRLSIAPFWGCCTSGLRLIKPACRDSQDSWNSRQTPRPMLTMLPVNAHEGLHPGIVMEPEPSTSTLRQGISKIRKLTDLQFGLGKAHLRPEICSAWRAWFPAAGTASGHEQIYRPIRSASVIERASVGFSPGYPREPLNGITRSFLGNGLAV
jgi:hypothetical protein